MLDNFLWWAKVVTTFLYDSFGSITNETVIGVAGTNTIERYYDSFGRDAGYALNGVRQSMLAYDPATGRLASMQIPAIEDKQNRCPPPPLFSTFQWTYLEGSDFKSSLAYPNGLTASWSYDANNQLLQVRNATPTNGISQFDYAYDAAGRRTAIAKSGTAFEFDDVVSYGYNARSELTNAVAALDTNYRYSCRYDHIGNRELSSERGTNTTYAANELNQYTQIAAEDEDAFIPEFDDDGNQTLVKTATGVWHVAYNGENRPVLWNQSGVLLAMSYDRMGRRVAMVKSEEQSVAQQLVFAYNGYLQIERKKLDNTSLSCWQAEQFVWDPTESVSTRPLVWNRDGVSLFYTHDGNKNVSEVISYGIDVLAHYEYAPFGALTHAIGSTPSVGQMRYLEGKEF